MAPLNEDKPTFYVEIGDPTGYSAYMMTQNEIAEKAAQTQGSWVFVNNQLVSTAEIANMDLEAGSRIRLMPGLSGCNTCKREFDVALDTGETVRMTGKEMQKSMDDGMIMFVNGAPIDYGTFHGLKKDQPLYVSLSSEIVDLVVDAHQTRTILFNDFRQICERGEGNLLAVYENTLVRNGAVGSVSVDFDSLYQQHNSLTNPRVRLLPLAC